MSTHRARLSLLAVWFVAALASHGQEKPSEVIYPRATPSEHSATGAAPAATRPGGSLLLLLATGAAAVGGWVLWRQRQGGGTLGPAQRKLAIAESRSLGNRQHLVVADYAGRKFLLGVCPGRIDLLAKLDEPTEEKRP